MNVTATRLAEAMRKRGWEQSDLAREIGATQGAISKIIVGKSVNSRLLPKIAIALHVALPWLLGTTDDPTIDVVQQLFTPQDLDWLESLHALPKAEREAVLQLAQALVTAVSARRGAEKKHPDRVEYEGVKIALLQSPKPKFTGKE